jgi:ABC-type transporter Mla MlaB component
MKNQTLQYYMHDGPSAFRFELAGDLDEEGARQLDQDWRTASSVIDGRTLIVDMTFVTNVDAAGKALLARWQRDGAQIVAKSKQSRELAEAAFGKPLDTTPRVLRPTQDGTWTPFQTSLSFIRKFTSHVSRVEAGVEVQPCAENPSDRPAHANTMALQLRSLRASASGAPRAS